MPDCPPVKPDCYPVGPDCCPVKPANYQPVLMAVGAPRYLDPVVITAQVELWIPLVLSFLSWFPGAGPVALLLQRLLNPGTIAAVIELINKLDGATAPTPVVPPVVP